MFWLGRWLEPATAELTLSPAVCTWMDVLLARPALVWPDLRMRDPDLWHSTKAPRSRSSPGTPHSALLVQKRVFPPTLLGRSLRVGVPLAGALDASARGGEVGEVEIWCVSSEDYKIKNRGIKLY